MRNILTCLLLTLALVSCVGTKEFTVNTEPEGAEITLNGKPVGKSPVTLTIEQDKSLGFVARKDGYALGAATVHTQPHWFYSLLWTKSDPKARYIEEDEVTIPLRPIADAADYTPVRLPVYGE
ncbi:MAG: PEGA domain-containing protein [Akkermansia sp.]|nr:PEGA domain-containing protein [Akkermansia sp.]